MEGDRNGVLDLGSTQAAELQKDTGRTGSEVIVLLGEGLTVE